MKNADALDILRAQGYAVGTPDAHTGRVRVWIRGSDEAVDVSERYPPVCRHALASSFDLWPPECLPTSSGKLGVVRMDRRTRIGIRP
jgi:hypothetical protein